MESDKEFLHNRLRYVRRITKIRGEASTRSFYRVHFDKHSLVAMVYPGENSEEIEKIVKLAGVYLQNNIPVPAVKDVIDNRVVLQEDLGDLLVQKAFVLLNKAEKKNILEAIAGILVRLKGVSTGHTRAILDTARMKWEMDFFLTHFAKNNQTLLRGGQGGGFLEKSPPGRRDCLYRMVESIHSIDTFAHRDFHSRNMLVHKGKIYLVDFQDSLVASPWYDLASFAFDCYLDLKSRRELLIDLLQERGIAVDRDQFYIVALQRNIKALGTFGYQVAVRKNLAYKKYIPRTVRYILANPLFDQFFKP
jgi:aminoglycoside/choline kinase family phosphotransferase